MGIDYLSIYLCLLQFLSNVSYSFQCTGLSPPWLNLFLSIFFILIMIVNRIIFLISLSASSLVVYRNATYFCILFYNLQFYCIHLLFLIVFWWSLQSFQYIKSCHPQIVKFYFFLSNLDAFYFLFLLKCYSQDLKYYDEQKRQE